MKHLIIFVLSSLFIIESSAQRSTVEGIVTDNTGTPLIGINIRTKGKQPVTTFTNLDGRYSIQVWSGDKLVFSAPGYKSKKEKFGKRKIIHLFAFFFI